MSTQQVEGCVGEWRNRGKGGSLCRARAGGCVGVSLEGCTVLSLPHRSLHTKDAGFGFWFFNKLP